MPLPKDKKKFSLWMHEKALEKVNELYESDNCISRSEFIEKAVLFYAGYLTAKDEKSYLPNMFLSAMKAITNESENRIGRMLFKLSVELAITMNVIAAEYEIDELLLERLRGDCIQEVKQLNGSLSFEEAVKWQRGG